ncbi:hypothetical protein [Streptomyces erythrochromogenes]|uniref:hypothetical protein n=1 Tax=Streptomyces erythrochromogenes TaxID=285574 RepID=UPI003813F9D1
MADETKDRVWRIFESVVAAAILAGFTLLWKQDITLAFYVGVCAIYLLGLYIFREKIKAQSRMVATLLFIPAAVVVFAAGSAIVNSFTS